MTVTSFAVLTKLVPTRVAFVTALAEAALNGAQAFGPFLGSILWETGGYRYSQLGYLLDCWTKFNCWDYCRYFDFKF